MTKNRPVMLVVLDGLGLNPIKKGNAVMEAEAKTLKFFLKNFPYAVIEASGMAVGLPWGEVGNSEVGHINLGAGRVIYQNLPRISLSIENKSFYKNQTLLSAIEIAKKKKGAIHLFGITSNGGVHGHIEHLDALLYLCKQEKVKDVFIHAILDGRDTAPKVGAVMIETLAETMKASKVGKFATIIGRYYAMDRNNNWERTEKSYNLMTNAIGKKVNDPIAAIKEAYNNGLNDENMEPLVIVEKEEPVGQIQDNDVVIFFNFRPDRARQITKAFVLDNFKDFKREKFPKTHFVTMMQYETNLPCKIVFEPQNIDYPLGRILSEAGKKQLRIAETEKYAHVTYFFNGGKEDPFSKEEHILIPSPNVASYDEIPEMSSNEVTETLIKKLKKESFDFILINYANPDMVGHTGNLSAAISAVKACDKHLDTLYKEFVLGMNGIMLIVADHGNVEVMIDPVSGEPNKEHTTNPVGMYLVDETRKIVKDEVTITEQMMLINPVGILADVAPTVLELLGLPKEKDMEGRSLVNDCY